MLRGATGSAIIVLAGAGAGFASQAGLARLLGTANFGLYAYVLVWATTLAMVGRVGMDLASLRFLAAYKASAQWGLFAGFVQFSRRMVVLVACVIAALAAAAVLALDGSRIDSMELVLIGAVLIPVMALQETAAAQLRAQKKVVSSQLPRYLIVPVGILAGAGLFYALGPVPLNPVSTLGVALAVHAAVMIYVLGRCASIQPEAARSAVPEVTGATWLRAGLVLMAVTLFHLINVRTDVLMLGVMRGMEDAGIFVAASQTAALTSLGLAGFGAIVAPVISELHSSARQAELQRSLAAAARGLAVYTIPVALVSIAFGKILLSLFGRDFSTGYVALVVLIVGHAASALVGPVAFLAIMTGHQGWAAWILGSSAAANVVLNAFLIPPYGMAGAAVATTVCKVLCNIGMLVFVSRRLGLNPTIFQFDA